MREGGDLFKGVSTPLPVDTDFILSFDCGPEGWTLWQDKVVLLSGIATDSIASLTDIITIRLGGDATNSLPFDGWMKDTVLTTSGFNQSTIDHIVDNDCYGYDDIGIKGQSNAVGRATLVAGIDDTFSFFGGRMVQMGFDSQTIDPLSQPLDHQDEGVGDMGFWQGLFRPLVSALGYKRWLRVIPAAKGNTDFPGWSPGGAQYEPALASCNLAASLSTLNVYRADIWYLGENAAADGDSAASIQSEFNATLADQETRQDDFSATTPVAFVKIMGTALAQSAYDEINDGLDLLAAESANRFVVEQRGTANVFDTLHLDAPSLRMLGTDIANVVFGTNPSVSATLGGPVGEQTGTYQITIDFGEDVSGLAVGDFIIADGSVDNLLGSGSSYTADVTPTSSATGNTIISLAGGDAADVYAVSNAASNQLDIPFDTGAPGANLGWVSEPILDDNGVSWANETGVRVVVRISDTAAAIFSDGAVAVDGSGIITIDSDSLGNFGDPIEVEISKAADSLGLIVKNATVIDLDA